jgi:glycosyltransferase involved in cell wall biosynthesis
MKIAQIVASLESRHGGPSQSVRGLAGALASAGQLTDLVTTQPSRARVHTEGNLTLNAYLRGTPETFCPSSGLRAHLGQASYDVVHAHGLWLRPLHHARRAAQRLNVPLVISPRGMMTSWAWHHHRARKWLAGHLVHPGALAAAQGWHATSAAEAEDIRRLGFTQPICVAPNGIDLPSSVARDEARAYWHELCPELTQRPAALFYSRFHAKKRVIEMIDLWLEIAPPHWIFLLVGIPEQYSVAQLTDYVQRQRGSSRVKVFEGIDRPAPYAAAELFLLPSHSENFGQSALEALAHGVPVLATDATPWAGLTARTAGDCVPWTRFGAALKTLLAEPVLTLRARGQHARAWAREDFSWDASARTVLEFYRTLGVIVT